jgi:DNA-binding NtrC family response regulator
MQVKLLRVLQERQFEAVGSNKTISVDTRVILATNQDLPQEVKNGRFREDLYYRINVVTVNLPPLVDRIGDVPLLAEHFMNRFCETHGRTLSGITEAAMQALQNYPWPGNVRELENVLERAVLLSKSQQVDTDDLPPVVIQMSRKPQHYSSYKPQSLKKALEGPECAFIRSALEANHWNRQETAKALDINRTTLYKKMKRYGLEDEALKMGL